MDDLTEAEQAELRRLLAKRKTASMFEITGCLSMFIVLIASPFLLGVKPLDLLIVYFVIMLFVVLMG